MNQKAHILAWEEVEPSLICASSFIRYTGNGLLSPAYCIGMRDLAVLSRCGVMERLYQPVGSFIQ